MTYIPRPSFELPQPVFISYERLREREQMSDKDKYDDGKPKLSLVPQQIITDIARVREYGVDKYGDKDNWRNVSIDRYLDAALRHMSAMVSNGVDAVDEESGIAHYAHAACNLAFIAQLIKEQVAETDKSINEQMSFLKRQQQAAEYCLNQHLANSTTHSLGGQG